MIKAIIFDIGDVLIEGMKKSHLLISEKLNCDANVVEKALHIPSHKEFFLGNLSEDQYLEKVKDFLNKHNINISIEELKKFLRESFKQIDDMINFASNFKKDFTVILLSNNSKEWVKFVEKRYNLDKLFPVRIYSFQVKLLKPDERIYRYIVKKFNLKPQEVFYVDDIMENVISAGKIGINAVKFEGREKLEEIMRNMRILK